MISPNQSGFRPGDSCINQLLTITHKIYKSSDEGFEVRGVFLDISKAFNKVWSSSKWDNIIAKVPQGSILGSLLFFIYINNLSNDLSVDDTPLFSVVNNIHTSATSQDLDAVTNWAFQ